MTTRRTLLIERLKMMAMILEAREDGLIKRFVPIIVKNFTKLAPNYIAVGGHVDPYKPDAYRKDLPDWYSTILPDPKNSLALARTAEGIIRFIVAMDPDPKATYSTWTVNMFAKGELNLEDTPRMFRALALYTECKRLNHIPRSHDIGTLKSLHDLYALVEPFSSRDGHEVVDTSYEKEMYRQSDVLLDTDSVLMVHPKTQEAAQWFGRNTHWCTAYGGKYGIHKDQTCLYSSYAPNGPLYIILDKQTGELFQFHRESESYMDKDDRRIDISTFSRRYPEVLHWFVTKDRDGRNQVGTVGQYIIYDTGNQLEAADGIGLSRKSTPLSITYAIPLGYNGDPLGPKTITGCHVAYHHTQAFEGSRELCDILTRLKFEGTVPSLNAIEITYDAKKKRYTTVRDAGTLVAKKDKYSWLKIAPKAGLRAQYRLYGDQNDPTIYLEAMFRTENSFYLSGDGEEEEEFDFSMMALLVRTLKNPNIEYDRSTGLELDQEPLDPDHIALTKEYPGTGNILMDWKINGDSDRFRKRFAASLQHDFPHAPRPENFAFPEGDKFTLIRFENITEAVSEIGNETAVYVQKVLEEGGDHSGDDSYVPDGLADELLAKLTPEESKAVWDYIVQEEDLSPEEASNYDSLDELYREFNTEAVKSAIESAASDGNRRGYENEVSKAFWKEIDSSGLMFYVTQQWNRETEGWEPTKPHWTKKSMHDTPCALTVSLSSFMAELAKGNLSDPWDDFDPINEMELKIELTEPQYGWSGFDDEAAHERFTEHLGNEGVL